MAPETSLTTAILLHNKVTKWDLRENLLSMKSDNAVEVCTRIAIFLSRLLLPIGWTMERYHVRRVAHIGNIGAKN